MEQRIQHGITDGSVLRHIEELARLRALEVELDQTWDLLRQRRALRAVGEDPDKAEIRPPDIVEKYEQ